MRALNSRLRLIIGVESMLPVESIFENPLFQLAVSGRVFIFYLG